jgi:cell division protein FtsN
MTRRASRIVSSLTVAIIAAVIVSAAGTAIGLAMTTARHAVTCPPSERMTRHGLHWGCRK